MVTTPTIQGWPRIQSIPLPRTNLPHLLNEALHICPRPHLVCGLTSRCLWGPQLRHQGILWQVRPGEVHHHGLKVDRRWIQLHLRLCLPHRKVRIQAVLAWPDTKLILQRARWATMMWPETNLRWSWCPFHWTPQLSVGWSPNGSYESHQTLSLPTFSQGSVQIWTSSQKRLRLDIGFTMIMQKTPHVVAHRDGLLSFIGSNPFLPPVSNNIVTIPIPTLPMSLPH